MHLKRLCRNLGGFQWVVFFLSFSTSSLGSSVDLDSAYQSALKRSEDLATQEELVIQAQERFSQVKGALFPTIVGTGSYLVQPTPNAATNISPPTQTNIKVMATQPLFQGFREYAGLRQQKEAVGVAELNRDQARVQIFQDLAVNFFQVLSYEKDLKNFKTELEVNQKRLKELYRFRQLGRSRQTEVLTLQANIASVEAQVEATKGQLENMRAIFAFMTGLPSNVPVVDREPTPIEKQNIGDYITGIENRPDVKAAAKAVLVSEEGIIIARAGHFPSLSAIGDYYFKRPGFLSDVNWDVQLVLTVPIFQGGVIQSQVRQASSVERQSEFALSKLRRTARQQIESYFNLFQTDYEQYDKQKIAVDLSMKNYQLEMSDYRLGLVTNIEVLSVLTTSQQNQRLLDRYYYQMKSDFMRLLAVSASRPSQSRKIQ